MRSQQIRRFVSGVVLVATMLAAAGWSSAGGLAAQAGKRTSRQLADRDEDDRDRVVLKGRGNRPGRVLSGRIVKIRGDHIELRQRGVIRPIPKATVQEIPVFVRQLVADAMLRWTLADNLAERWEAMTDYTTTLPRMVRVAAYTVLGEQPNHGGAHLVLGHQQRGKQWLWRWRGELLPKAKFEKAIARIGRPFELESEHFIVRTDAGSARAAKILLDLESLYAFWQEEFGDALSAREVLEPMPVIVRREAKQFSKLGPRPRGYYDATPNSAWKRDHHGVIYSFYEAGQTRPDRLIEMGTQQVLHHTMMPVKASPQWTIASLQNSDAPYSVAPWLEHGLGDWVASHARGPAGRTEFESGARDLPRAHAQALAHSKRQEDRYDLRDLLLSKNSLFFGGTSKTQLRWDQSRAWVVYLMNNHRAGVERFLREAFAGGKGNSTSRFRKAFGQRIERFCEDWRRWVLARAR